MGDKHHGCAGEKSAAYTSHLCNVVYLKTRWTGSIILQKGEKKELTTYFFEKNVLTLILLFFFLAPSLLSTCLCVHRARREKTSYRC